MKLKILQLMGGNRFFNPFFFFDKQLIEVYQKYLFTSEVLWNWLAKGFPYYSMALHIRSVYKPKMVKITAFCLNLVRYAWGNSVSSPNGGLCDGYMCWNWTHLHAVLSMPWLFFTEGEWLRVTTTAHVIKNSRIVLLYAQAQHFRSSGIKTFSPHLHKHLQLGRIS